jgi:hypothetical protein
LDATQYNSMCLKNSQHQLEIWWLQIGFTGDTIFAVMKSTIDAVNSSNTIQLSSFFVLSVLLRFTDSDYPFAIVKLFLSIHVCWFVWLLLFFVDIMHILPISIRPSKINTIIIPRCYMCIAILSTKILKIYHDISTVELIPWKIQYCPFTNQEY